MNKNSMRIAIDISQVVYGTGVSVYTKQLIRHLLRLDQKNTYLLFGGSARRLGELEKFAKEFEKKAKYKLFKMPPTLADLIWNRLHKPSVEVFIGKVDILHSSDWTQPPAKAIKITTIHDLAPLKFPELTPKNVVDVHKRRLYWVRKEVDHIIVPSEATKNDLIELDFAENKIHIIPEAADPKFKPASSANIKNVLRKYDINGPYLLCIGINKRKNTQNILSAYSQLQKRGIKLVFVGNPMGFTFPKSADISVLGYVASEDLPALYSNAAALVYPSLYEGFGLPVLEAFACGCPVVTSITSSLPEVAGNAAVLVDPNEPSQIAEGIEEALKKSKSLIQKGYKQAEKFSWERTARETLKLYNSV